VNIEMLKHNVLLYNKIYFSTTDTRKTRKSCPLSCASFLPAVALSPSTLLLQPT